jgi:hypothetical protein
LKSFINAKFSLTIIAIIILYSLGNWFYNEKSTSFSEPEEALLNVEKDVLLIPAYKAVGESLFFIVKDKNQLAAVYIQEAIFGWKLGEGDIPFTTIGDPKDYEKISNYKVHDDFLVYGLVKNVGNSVIKVNGEDAKIISLEKILDPNDVKRHNFQDMYLWYYESGADVLSEGEIEVFSKDNQELLDSTELIFEKKQTLN